MNSALLPVVGVALLAALVYKFLDFVKFVTNKDVNSIVTQLGAWVAGVAGVFVVAATQFAGTVKITDTLNLDQLDTPTKFVTGILIGSGASTLIDFKKARDNTDSSAVPALLPGANNPPVAPPAP